VGIADREREAAVVGKQVIRYLDGLDLVIGSGLGLFNQPLESLNLGCSRLS